MIRKPLAIACLSVLSLAACAPLDFHQDSGPAPLSAAEMDAVYDAVPYPAEFPTSTAHVNSVPVAVVFFATDSDVLTQAARNELQTAAVLISRIPNSITVIQGFADERGSREYNLRLAARRSLSVARFLASQGVPVDETRAATFGIENPVLECSREPCWRENRRVEVHVSQGDDNFL